MYGVLTDNDLSSWRKGLQNDHTKTSQQRTGTPSYMAFELLEGLSATHLYRHDLESLYCVMLFTAALHTIAPTKGEPSAEGKFVMRSGTPPYQEWFRVQGYDTL